MRVFLKEKHHGGLEGGDAQLMAPERGIARFSNLL
jgi:hypothetical protein